MLNNIHKSSMLSYCIYDTMAVNLLSNIREAPLSLVHKTSTFAKSSDTHEVAKFTSMGATSGHLGV